MAILSICEVVLSSFHDWAPWAIRILQTKENVQKCQIPVFQVPDFLQPVRQVGNMKVLAFFPMVFIESDT